MLRNKSDIILSIIIPAYNCEPYINECLNSILDYNPKGVEIVVVDDGSTDDTPRIAEAYAARDKRLQLIRQQNAGTARARTGPPM